MRPGGRLLVVSRPASINTQAEQKGWAREDDGYWSSAARGMFQKGYSLDDLASLVSLLPCAAVRAPAWGGDLAAVVATKGG